MSPSKFWSDDGGIESADESGVELGIEPGIKSGIKAGIGPGIKSAAESGIALRGLSEGTSIRQAETILLRQETSPGSSSKTIHKTIHKTIQEAIQEAIQETFLKTMQETMQERVLRLARESGFAYAGIAAAEAEGDERQGYLEEWIASGQAGEMEYLKRRTTEGALVRSSLEAAAPWARSVIVCMAPYHAAEPLSTDPAGADAGWIARYAWSGARDAEGSLRPADYHKVLLARLKQMEQALCFELGDGLGGSSGGAAAAGADKAGGAVAARGAAGGAGAGSLDGRGGSVPDCEGEGRSRGVSELRTWAYVDTGPVIERAWAARAGVGWTGKNTCTLHQQFGSFFFLGVILTSLELPKGARLAAAADRCGSCTRCIDACPTQALVAPRQMDASRCISYLTIEKRGAIAEELRGGMGRQVFGCDICQDVCPWNSKAPVAVETGRGGGLEVRPELVNPPLGWLAGLSEAEFGRVFYGSPVKRAKYAGLRRNVAIAMGNSGDAGFVPQLREWASGGDAVLADAAGWALGRLGGEGLGGLG